MDDQVTPAEAEAGAVAGRAGQDGFRARPGGLDRPIDGAVPGMRESADLLLVEGLRLLRTSQSRAGESFEQARRIFVARADIGGELAAIQQLVAVAWIENDTARLAQLLARVIELDQLGDALAASLAAAGRAMLAYLHGDFRHGLVELSVLAAAALAPPIAALADWLEAQLWDGLGEGPAVLAAATRHRARAGGQAEIEPFGYLLMGAEATGLWWVGRRDEARRVADEAGSCAAVAYHPVTRLLWCCDTAILAAWVGDLDRARLLPVEEVAVAAADEPIDPATAQRVALARATAAVAGGHDGRAADLLRRELAVRPLGPDARSVPHLRALALTYVLCPETRPTWDARPLGPTFAASRDAARLVLAARAGAPVPSEALAGLGDRLVSHLPARWAAELVAGPAPPRSPSTVGGAAGTAVAADIRVLGVTELRRVGSGGDAPRLRRRVRELLSLLVEHGEVRRKRLEEELWPDLDPTRAGSNLRITLKYLLDVLDPGRTRTAGAVVRADADTVALVRDGVMVDAWRFAELLRVAQESEARGRLAAALEAYWLACSLYRGPYLPDAPDVDWLDGRRRHLEREAVDGCVRCAELLLAIGAPAAAATWAGRAVEIDGYHEPAYRLLAETQRRAGDRSGALATLASCRRALADLGVPVEAATRELELALATADR